MVEVIPNRLQKTWEIWNVRGVILFSLSLQIVLFLGAPMRKRTGNRLSILIIWASYFLADWAASFTIGLITSSKNSSKIIERSDLLAFWAPFLLLHLGGPDTITAFALEDNELWLRHFLTLIFQVLASFYVFLETLPNNKLWLPTSLIFLAGVVKYSERTRSLYLASWGTFRETMLTEPDAGPEYAKLMESYSSKKVARLPTTMSQTVDADIRESKSAFYSFQRREKEQDPLNDFEVVRYGYHFFKIFKGLIVDLISHNDRNESIDFFRKRNADDALKVLEVELNFIYEVLYTKFFVIHDLIGYLLRSVSSLSILASLGIFFFVDCKQGLDKFDIRVTYTLLLGALSLEAIALFKLIFSDWTTAFIDKKSNTNQSVLTTIFRKYLKIRRSRWYEWKDDSGIKVLKRATPVLLRRWSESVAGFNLIKYCLKDLPKKSNEENDQCCLGISKTTIRRYCCKEPVDRLGIRDFLDELKYASNYPFTINLWEFIFLELLRKSGEADKQKNMKISSARGAYVLEEYCKNKPGEEVVLFETLKTDYIESVTFDESLLLWHIATALCYHGSEVDQDKKAQPDEQELSYHGSEVDQDKKAQPDEQELSYHGSKVDQDKKPQPDEQELSYHGSKVENKFISKHVSDYMLYLLVMKPTMMSAVAGIGQIRYRDTCAEAKRFFRNKGLGPNNIEKDACENLLAVNTDVKPAHVKGDRSKSVLFDACMLAKELQKLEEKKKWEVISRVWVEMLSYASNHCRPNAHSQQVSRGGQLINLVWLLMAHFGLVEQFVFTAGFGPAKLTVEK
ncbi:hypothetical protein I3842_15G051600 [Carya illinoinensis]|uniref:DUF4220 domain-containing protein n=1 Tax=Carya illinoinensis TaxID=32201 RepID=A0A922A647_CARIL|nr:hypothetical protein I3842_15G051600 [Carya illinoinensis]KAG6674603.1 hypothetical protein I3842_15G051600 [Carya illinoinensis]